ncbi:DNA polymerase zeta subunit 2 [Haematobia irritans]|uniref:DNA polymerase zeta subunit 2 n=1 Tax=Haematobia irritans TaxID=7368 RepID=UPI003F5040E1
MDNDLSDILVEALEVFTNHILYTRDVYPAQIFKKRRIYNTPVYTSIYPPLNSYLYNVFRILREILKTKELDVVEVLLYKSVETNTSDEIKAYESYKFEIMNLLESKPKDDDEFLLDFEEQLRSSLYTLSERLKPLQKLPSDCKFKIQIYTTQAGFMRLSHEPHYQEFPWLRTDLKTFESTKNISLLPLAFLRSVGLSVMADVA